MLLVEDDFHLREALADVLEAEGHAVTALATASAALGVLGQPGAPRLVLLDLRMPGMDGLSFLDALRARPDSDRFRVILMSADSKVTTFEGAPGVAAVLQKPFETGELLAVLGMHAA